MAHALLTGAILLAGGADLVAIALGKRRWRYLFKPGTMLLIIALAAMAAPGAGRYGWLVLIGLLFSVAGDIFLVLPGDRLIPGLASFLVAHLFYIAAFPIGRPFDLQSGLIAGGLVIACLLLFWRLRAGVLEEGGGLMQLPVLLYMGVISLMLLRAYLSGNPLLLAGGLLFYLSDAVLAWDRFAGRLRWGDLAVMTTYFGAQYLFALSVVQGV